MVVGWRKVVHRIIMEEWTMKWSEMDGEHRSRGNKIRKETT